jgi:hypothetical protein
MAKASQYNEGEKCGSEMTKKMKVMKMSMVMLFISMKMA